MTSIQKPISNFRASFWKRTVPKNPKPVSLDKVTYILSKKFPYMQLRDLASIDRLKIVIDPDFPNLPDKNDCIFLISHSGFKDNGHIIFTEYPQKKEIACAMLTPDLPKRLPGTAATLFSLMLIRGNSFIDQRIRLAGTNKRSYAMATDKMTIFSPEELKEQGRDHDSKDIILTPPILSKNELNAIEWYWRNIINQGYCKL